jgi:DNA-binding XRE family transcriptional regulator
MATIWRCGCVLGKSAVSVFRMEISPAQCRMARALLNWTQEKLAAKVGVAHKTIYNFEKELRTPLNVSRAAIQQAFEQAGIEFLPNDGVRRKS